MAWQERKLDHMRRVAGQPDDGPRYAIGAEMDRPVTAFDVELAEQRLAECRAYAALQGETA